MLFQKGLEFQRYVSALSNGNVVGGELSFYSALTNDCRKLMYSDITMHDLEFLEWTLMFAQCVSDIVPVPIEVTELEGVEGR